jgi:hypothetical protein
MREEVVRGHVPGDAWRGISDNAPKCCFVVYLREAPILPRMRLRLSELATSAPVTLGKGIFLRRLLSSFAAKITIELQSGNLER